MQLSMQWKGSCLASWLQSPSPGSATSMMQLPHPAAAGPVDGLWPQQCSLALQAIMQEHLSLPILVTRTKQEAISFKAALSLQQALLTPLLAPLNPVKLLQLLNTAVLLVNTAVQMMKPRKVIHPRI